MSWRSTYSSYTPRDSSAGRYGSSSLASKYESPSSGERQSRWSLGTRSTSSSESTPVWAKASITDNPSSVVQRLKERYNVDTPPKTDRMSELRAKRAETKDLSASLPRTYGRTNTTTTTNMSDTSKEPEVKREVNKDYGYSSYERKPATPAKTEPEPEPYSRFRKKEKSPEPEKTSSYDYRTRRPDYQQSNSYNSPLESRTKIYTSSSLGSSPSTSRYLTPKKYPTSPSGSASYTSYADRYPRNEVKYEKSVSCPEPVSEKEVVQEVSMQESMVTVVTVVTRETSPTQPSASLYLRTRRADMNKGVESKVTRPKVRPESCEKETQTEKPEEHVSKYSTSVDTPRAKPWSYSSGTYSGSTGSGSSSSYGSRYSSTSARTYTPLARDYGGYTSSLSRYDSDYKRSISKEEATPLSPAATQASEPQFKSQLSVTLGEVLTAKPPAPVRPPAADSVKPALVKDVKEPLRKSASTKSGSSLDVESTTSSEPRESSAASSDDKIKSPSPLPDSEPKKSPLKKSLSKSKSKSPLAGKKTPTPEAEAVQTDKDDSLSESSRTDSKSEKAKSPKTKTPEKSNSSVSITPEKSKSPAVRTPSKTPDKAISPVKLITPPKTPDKAISPVTIITPPKTPDKVKTPLVKTPEPKVKSPTPEPSLADKSAMDSSSSESSSDETSESESEEHEQTSNSLTSSVKRSITNFLQNIPNPNMLRKPTSSCESLARASSTAKLGSRGSRGSMNKIKFKHIESGERAWWLDSTDKVPEGIAKMASNRSIGKTQEEYHIPKQCSASDWWLKDDDENHNHSTNHSRGNIATLPPRVPSTSHTPAHLAPPYLINRQYSSDKDWLKSSSEDVSKQTAHKLDNATVRQCNGDNTWWLDDNDNVETDNKEDEAHAIHVSLKLPKFPVRHHSPEQPWWMETETNLTDETEEDKTNKEANSMAQALEALSNVWQDVGNCDNVPRVMESVQRTEVEPSTERNNNVPVEDGEEEIDVTPALRRRREQQQAGLAPDNYHEEDPSYQMKFNLEEKRDVERDGNKYLEDFKMECSVKDLTQKLVNQNGLGSPLEEKINLLEQGDMSGMISKAKAELLKSQSKMRKSSSGEMSPKVELAKPEKSEIELYWSELVESMSRPLRLCDLDFTDLHSDEEDNVMGPRVNGGVPPPPPPAVPLPPMRSPALPAPPPPPVVKNKKTVKLFWKEVKDDSLAMMRAQGNFPLIWDELSRVAVDTQKLEHLFQSRAKDVTTKSKQEQNKSKEVIVLDHKRSNAINIGMTKLPPPRAIKTAILKMDATVVNKEGIEKLLSMLPTEEEILRIQDAQTGSPDLPLGSAEQFLLTLASITELEARLKLWAFKMDFENSEREICEPLMDLKQGMDIMRINKTFRGILSTLLSVGNFLNGCDVKGFQIDYLSKVPEVKDTVHKHSLLHHLCYIVMEKFPDSTDLYSEIGCVTRAAKVDFEELTGNIKKVEEECKLSWSHLKIIAKHEGHTTMKMKMSDFLADSAERIIVLGIVHRRVLSRFRKFILWLGVPLNRVATTRPNEVFKVISEFALEYRTTRERVLAQVKKINHRERSRTRGVQATDLPDSVDNHAVNPAVKKMNSKEAKDDAKLRQLLGNNCTSTTSDSPHPATWRRHRRETKPLPDTNHNDDEIIETLIKTANQIPSSRATLKERRRSRIVDRKLCE